MIMGSRAATWIIALLGCVIVSVSEQIGTNDLTLQKKIHECFDETGVPMDMRKKNPMRLLDHPDLKCFAACMMKKKGTMINDKINPEKHFALIKSDSNEIVKQIVSKCSAAANQQKNQCEVAHDYLKCLMRTIYSFPK